MAQEERTLTHTIRRIRYVGRSPEIGRPMWNATSPEPAPRAEEIERCLRRLSAVQQDIVERRFWRAQSLEQISRALDISAAQTRRELHKALKKLQLHLVSSPAEIHYPQCKLCTHPERDKIDDLLRTRTHSGTWQGYLQRLKAEFGVGGLPAKALDAHIQMHTLPKEYQHDLTEECPR